MTEHWQGILNPYGPSPTSGDDGCVSWTSTGTADEFNKTTFRPKPYVPIIDRIDLMQIEEALAEPGMISEQEFDEMVNFAPDNMTPTQRCRSAKARLLNSYNKPKELAIIDLVDEYMRNEPQVVDEMCNAKLYGSHYTLQQSRDKLTEGAIAYVRDKKAGIPILGGIIWFFIRGLVARIVADYISDLLFSVGE